MKYELDHAVMKFRDIFMNFCQKIDIFDYVSLIIRNYFSSLKFFDYILKLHRYSLIYSRRKFKIL